MTCFLIILAFFLICWVFPAYLMLNWIYRQLDGDSTIKDLLEYEWETGWLSLIPLFGYFLWFDHIEFKTPEFITKLLNKKIK